MHSVELTEEEIKEILHAMYFTENEGLNGDDEVWSSIYAKLDKALDI